MKKMKKLFFSVFALSALILSACSGHEASDTSSTPSSSSQTPTTSVTPSESSEPEESSVPEESSIPEESSSAEEESSSQEGSSSEPIEFKADYQIKIGNAVYDLLLNEGQTEHDKEYYLGAGVSKAVVAGEAISFKKLQNDEYQVFTVAPSPDDVAGLTYNNVIPNGAAYEIRASGSVEVYLKLDGTEWSYWISGGGDMEDPFYTAYRLAYGTADDDPTWAFDNAVAGDEAQSTEQGIDKQLKFSFQTGEAVGFKIRNEAGDEWYGSKFLEQGGTEEDGNIALEAGDYDIYFKLHTDGGYSIWVSKYGPALVENYYYSFGKTGEKVAFAQRYESSNLWNQFYKEEVAITESDELYLWVKDSDGNYSDGAQLINGADEIASALMIPIIPVTQGDPVGIKLSIGGTYSFYFNEEVPGGLKWYLVRKEGMPTEEVMFAVEYETTDGQSLYVVGNFNDWTPSADYKLHWTEGNIWRADAEDASKGLDLPLGGKFKLVVAPTESPTKDNIIAWEGGADRIVTKDYEVDSWGVDSYLVSVGGAYPTTLTKVENPDPEENKYAEYTVKVTADEYDTLSFYFNGTQKALDTSKWVFEGNAEGGCISVAGSVDIYLKLFAGTGESAGQTIYKVWASTPAAPAKAYACSINKTPVDKLEDHAIEKGENVWAYTFELAENDEVVFTEDAKDMQFVHWDSVKEEPVAEGTTFKADAAGTYNFYYKQGHGIYHDYKAPTPVSTYSATINSEEVKDLADHAIDKGENVWAYAFELKAGDVIAFTADGKAMNLVHYDKEQEEPVVVEGTSLTADADGTYKFFYKANEGIYHSYEAPVVLTKVMFAVEYETVDGQSLYVVGDFNGWTPSADYKLHWTEGNIWRADAEDASKGLDLPLNGQFKLVVAPTENPTKENIIAEEGGLNRTVVADLSVDSWQINKAYLSVNDGEAALMTDVTSTMTSETNKYAEYKLTVDGKENDTLKLYYNDAENPISADYLTFEGNAENGKIKADGSTDIYLKLFYGTDEFEGETVYKVWASAPAVVHVYKALINGENGVTLTENKDTDKTDGRLAEYYGSVTASLNDVLSFSIDDVAISTNIGPDQKDDVLVPGNNIKEDFKVRTAGTFTVYLKVYEGGYSVWAAGLELPKTTYNLSLGNFAKSGQYIMLHSWGGELGNQDQVLYDGTGEAPTSFSIDYDATGYLFCRLKAGETDYGEGWINKDAQLDGKIIGSDIVPNGAPTIEYMDVAEPYFEIEYPNGQIVFGVTADLLSSKAVYLVGDLTGGWGVENLVKLNNDGSNWSVQREVAAGTYNYKFVIAAANNPTSIEDWDTLNQNNRWIKVI